ITDKFFAIKSSDGTHHLFVEHDTAFQHVGTLPPGEHLGFLAKSMAAKGQLQPEFSHLFSFNNQHRPCFCRILVQPVQ
ncbi:MAG: hypothetical protein AAF243_06800, partial [Cyanobacteria bacterium P01_A01_bin.137]